MNFCLVMARVGVAAKVVPRSTLIRRGTLP